MKRLISVLTVIAGLGLADTYVLPTRLDLGIFDPTFSLQKDTWTNTTTWLTGQMDGNQMVDFSPDRTNAVIESPCVVFDGVGDYVYIANSIFTATNLPWTVEVRVLYILMGGDRSYVCGESFGRAGVWIGGVNEVFSVRQKNSLGGQATYGVVPLTGYNEQWITLKWDYDGNGTVNCYVDETFIESFSVQLSLGTKYIATRGLTTYTPGTIAFIKMSGYNAVDSSPYSFYIPFSEGSGSTVYDVSGNGNHGTITTTSGLSTMWSGMQTNSPYFAKTGGLTFSDGTNTVYVPQLSDGSAPATNAISGYSLARTNGTGYAHNAGPYSLIFGGATNTYANLLTNSADNITVTTNAAGLIESLYEVAP